MGPSSSAGTEPRLGKNGIPPPSSTGTRSIHTSSSNPAAGPFLRLRDGGLYPAIGDEAEVLAFDRPVVGLSVGHDDHVLAEGVLAAPGASQVPQPPADHEDADPVDVAAQVLGADLG